MRELTFTLSNLSLKGLAFGDPSKPMVLALHGWLDNAASFVPIADYLDDYYIVALDLSGHGHSSHRAAGSHYHLLDYVHDLHELVELQQWQSFILLGHSLGGIIASIYASCFNEKVTKLVSIESFGPMTQNAQSSATQLRKAIESRLKTFNSKPTHPSSLEKTIELRAKVGEMSHESAATLIQRNIEKVGDTYLFRTDRRLRITSNLVMTDEQAEAFLSHIKCPMLLIVGTKGFASLKEAVVQRKPCIKDLTSVECEGGHHLHMDNPQQVAKQIVNFLN